MGCTEQGHLASPSIGNSRPCISGEPKWSVLAGSHSHVRPLSFEPPAPPHRLRFNAGEHAPPSPVAISGERGYMAPEYYSTGVMTYKSDIYSLGVMIMEILTGEKELCTIENVGVKILWLP
nr:unnamed protein product [Digitaria exilis]